MIFTYERDLISDAFHRKNIALRVQRDPRTNLSKNLLLGCPFHHVRFGIIKNGSIDFDAGYTSRFGALTPTDLVMLYCYLYLPRHHAELQSTFDRCSTWIDDVSIPGLVTWLVDLGCGPGTAGLAFADHCRGAPFHYFGFDRSSAMRSTAQSVLNEARLSGLIDRESKFSIASEMFNPAIIHDLFPIPVNIIFVASYLFASKSLDIVSLAQTLNAVILRDRVKAAVFLYVNSTTKFANRSYERFVRELGPIRRLGVKEQQIQYRRYAGRIAGKAQFVNDCMILKELSP